MRCALSAEHCQKELFMKTVIGVKFKTSPKVYYFLAGDHEYKKGCGVIVETQRGVEYARVVMLPFELEAKKSKDLEVKPITRLATAEDDLTLQKQDEKYRDTMRQMRGIINDSNLGMKLANIEFAFDNSKIIVNFTAENRVDFRDLVKKLSGHFKSRIELKQIGVRDECRSVGALGVCGRACCCSSAISDYPHVSIKMAKNQGLSLNPTKISGTCGRLMCCLQYEDKHYCEINQRMPKMGGKVKTTCGQDGTVVGIAHLKERVKLKIVDKDNYSFSEFPLGDLIFKARAPKEIEKEQDDDLPKELKDLE